MNKPLQSNDNNEKAEDTSSKVPHNSNTAVDLEDHPYADKLGSSFTSPGVVIRKRKYLAIGICSVVFIGLVVALWFWLAPLGSSNEVDRTDSGGTAAVEPKDEHVAAAFAEVKGEAAVIETVTSLGGQTTEGALVFDFAPYQVGGASFKTLPATGDGTAVRVTDASTATAAFKAAHERLTTQGKMTRTSDSVKDAGGLVSQDKASITSYAVYRSQDAICSLAHVTGSGTHVVSIGCASIAEYEKAASAIRPFAEVYAKANPTLDAKATILGAPDIADGKDGIKGATLYQRVQGNEASSGVYLYYKNVSNSAWQLLGGPYSNTVPCKAFVTNEQKAAFAGHTCNDEAQKKDRAI